MRKIFENFYKCSVIAIIATFVGMSFTDAAVTPRQTNANKAAAARVPNRIATSAPKKSATTTPEPEPEPEPVVVTEPEPEPEKPIVVDNKASMFQDVLSEIGASTTDRAAQERADMIRRQREQLMQQDAQSTAGTTNMGSANACDAGLRQCMMEKCGDGFTKCANDSTIIWNTKIDSCRNKTKCSAHEYTLLAPEILADRDLNVQLSHYDAVIKCGNNYNKCIFGECGTTLEKCLSKKDGDAAISKCATIANECKSMDNGLASRVMSVFGDLRKIASARVPKDEKRLYELRDLMRAQCNRLGAAFDERTLDCVYTVSFFAGEDRTLMASKKLYPAQSFQCNPNWFGIDITTFRENAYRLTRAQRSASSAMLGAGVGTAAGLIASGAIDRAIKTQRTEKAVKEECESHTGYKWNGKDCVDKDGNPIKPGDDGNNNNNGNNPNSDGNENQDEQNKGLSAPINITITDMQNNPIEGGQIGCVAGEEWDEYLEALFARSNSKGLATLTLPNGLSEDTECIIRGDPYCGDSKQMTIKQLRTQTEPIKLDCPVHLNSDCQRICQGAKEHINSDRTPTEATGFGGEYAFGMSENDVLAMHKHTKECLLGCQSELSALCTEKLKGTPQCNGASCSLDWLVDTATLKVDDNGHYYCNRHFAKSSQVDIKDTKQKQEAEKPKKEKQEEEKSQKDTQKKANDKCKKFCNGFNPSDNIVTWFPEKARTLYDEYITNDCILDNICYQKIQEKCKTLIGKDVHGVSGTKVDEAWAHDIKEKNKGYYYGCSIRFKMLDN